MLETIIFYYLLIQPILTTSYDIHLFLSIKNTYYFENWDLEKSNIIQHCILKCLMEYQNTTRALIKE